MHRRSARRTRLNACFLVGVGYALVFLFAVATAMAGDRAAAPDTQGDREAFLAGTGKDCRGCDLREAKLKRRDLSGRPHRRRSHRRRPASRQARERKA